MKRSFIIFLSIFLLGININYTQTELTLNDAVLGYYKGLYPKNVRGLKWKADVDEYFYATDTSWLVKSASGCKLKKEYSLSYFKQTFPDIKRVPNIEYMRSNLMMFRFGNELIFYSEIGRHVEKVILPKEANNIDISYKATAVAYTVDNNLYLHSSDGVVDTITNFKDKNIVSGQAIHRYEFGISKGIFWSPDGNKIAFYQKDETDVADYPLLDINKTPGELKSIKYPMAGQKSEYAKVGVYDLTTKKTIYLKTTGTKDSYLTNLTWGPNSEKIYLAQVNRGQDDMHLNSYLISTGEFEKMHIHQSHEKWIEPEYPIYFNPSNEKEFIWISEKDGFQAPYLYNLETKSLELLVKQSFPITSVLGFTKDGKYFDYMATGTDGRNNLGYRLELKTKQVSLLTTSSGTHSIKRSYSGKYISDNYSDFKTPRKVDIVEANKQKRKNILTANNPLQGYDIGVTSALTLKSEDGKKLYARTILPYDFDKTKKYPVLVYVYGGPHAQMVTNSYLSGASLWMHWMANQGYIVFTLDGRGSANRGFEFENVIHRKLGENEMKDQLVGVNYLKSLDYIDSNRLAVHGWSFGGFMTTSLMLNYPDVFTTGVAGGPVMDWKWYEIMYGERYMDTPKENPEGYAQTSTLNQVDSLKGKLLTIHGTIDDVVVMQHNLAFIQACISSGVQTDFFAYPMHPHNVRGRDRVHLMTKVLTYIIENNK